MENADKGGRGRSDGWDVMQNRTQISAAGENLCEQMRESIAKGDESLIVMGKNDGCRHQKSIGFCSMRRRGSTPCQTKPHLCTQIVQSMSKSHLGGMNQFTHICFFLGKPRWFSFGNYVLLQPGDKMAWWFGGWSPIWVCSKPEFYQRDHLTQG